MSKTHWKKMHNPDYLGAYSLMDGRDNPEMNVVIKRVVRQKVKGTDGKEEECTVAHLENQKPLILNATNSKTIEKIFDSPYIEDWQGKTVTLFVKRIKAFGEHMDAVRVKQYTPKKKITLKEGAEDFQNCVKALIDGYTLEQIQVRYSVSEDVKTKLMEEVNNG